jgi:hypothetical protein
LEVGGLHVFKGIVLGLVYRDHINYDA